MFYGPFFQCCINRSLVFLPGPYFACFVVKNPELISSLVQAGGGRGKRIAKVRKHEKYGESLNRNVVRLSSKILDKLGLALLRIAGL